MESELSQYITLIIPAHNRHLYLERVLDYYSNCNFRIIVSDSSEKKFEQEKVYPNVIYRHFPNAHLAVKITKILNLIETPYVFMCAEDDFIIPNAICQIISFLEKNQNYSSAQGITLRFYPRGKHISIEETTDIHYRNLNIDSDLPSQRIMSLAQCYTQIYYSVVRTDLFCKMYKSCVKDSISQINNLCLLEIFLTLYSMIYGKHMVLPVLYSCREQIPNSAGRIIDDIVKISSLSKYKDEYILFKNILAKYLFTKEQKTIGDALAIIDRFLYIHINEFRKGYIQPVNKVKYYFQMLIKKFLGNRIIGFLKSRISPRSEFESSIDWIYIENYIKKYSSIIYK